MFKVNRSTGEVSCVNSASEDKKPQKYFYTTEKLAALNAAINIKLSKLDKTEDIVFLLKKEIKELEQEIKRLITKEEKIVFRVVERAVFKEKIYGEKNDWYLNEFGYEKLLKKDCFTSEIEALKKAKEWADSVVQDLENKIKEAENG